MEGGGDGGGGRGAGSQRSKTKTPHKDVGSKPCSCRLPKFSIDVSRNTSVIHLQPADTIWSESSISSKTRKSLRHQSFLPIPVHQLIKDIPWLQFRTNYSAVCCFLEHNKNKTPKPTHTRDPRRRRTKHRRGQHKNKRPTVSANPHLPKEDRRVRQLKLSSFCQSFKIALHYPFAIVLKLPNSNSPVVSTFMEQRLRSRH